MKIMKVLGVVVGIHVFALILIFANPGCSATTKPAPAPSDTMSRAEPAPAVSVPGVSPSVSLPMTDGGSPISAAPYAFNPDAPALAANGGVRFTPTRPGTAAASTLIADPVADVVPVANYVVKSGDSLWTIAKKNHLSVSDLAAANNLKASAPLHQGQKLLIPSKAGSALAAATPLATSAAAGAAPMPKPASVAAAKASGDAIKHTVKSGETLGTIARKYEVKQGDIAVANNITDPQKIYAGMELVIPGWQAAGGKSSGKSTTSSATKSAETTKAAVPEIKPLFSAPGSTPEIGPKSSAAVPVIKVDEAPAPGKP